ncbi:MAG: hypothetical protein DI535_11085 [Citrobacter freundii]|nr:MAG: hypothetical protein DI535_11085 [Citrobacter freundii]
MKILLCAFLLLSAMCLRAQKNELQTCVANTFLKMDSLLEIGKDPFYEWHDCIKGKQLPGFAVKTMDGQVIDSNTIKGKILILDFFSIYCHPCYENIPALNRLVAEYKDKGLIFLCLVPEKLEWMKTELLSKYRLDFAIVPDAEKVIDIMGGSGYPKTFIVDQQGKIAELWPGGPIDANLSRDMFTIAKPHIDKLLGSSTHKQ